jgi:hypothetical protein
MSNQLSDLIASAKDMNDEQKKALLSSLGIQLSSNGTARIAKDGETKVEYVSDGKTKSVLMYPTPIVEKTVEGKLVKSGGTVHFQGIPGASAKWGLSLYSATIDWLFAHMDEINEFREANADRLSYK